MWVESSMNLCKSIVELDRDTVISNRTELDKTEWTFVAPIGSFFSNCCFALLEEE